MISLELIKKRIRDYEQDTLADKQTELAKIDILYWVIQNNVVKTEEEINTKITRLQEELLGLSNKQCSRYIVNTTKIKELERILFN